MPKKSGSVITLRDFCSPGRLEKMKEQILDNIAELATAEKILLVEALWDRLAVDPEEVPVPSAQRKELDRRLALYRKNPEQAKSWSEVGSGLEENE